MIADAINGTFELVAGWVSTINISALLKSKKVQGVHWAPTAFFSAWGVWNLFYYPILGQWVSFVGGIGIVVSNLIWLGLAWRYRNAK